MTCTRTETRDLGFEWCRLSGEPLGFCDCGTCAGEWGAWRSITPILTEMAVYYQDNPEKWDNLTHFALWYFWANAYLNAVGWSP